jgi:hypothetical protein
MRSVLPRGACDSHSADSVITQYLDVVYRVHDEAGLRRRGCVGLLLE